MLALATPGAMDGSDTSPVRTAVLSAGRWQQHLDLLTSRVVVSAGELGEDWVVSELEKTLEALADRVAEMRADPTNDNSRLSDDMSEPLCRSSLELPFQSS